MKLFASNVYKECKTVNDCVLTQVLLIRKREKSTVTVFIITWIIGFSLFVDFKVVMKLFMWIILLKRWKLLRMIYF